MSRPLTTPSRTIYDKVNGLPLHQTLIAPMVARKRTLSNLGTAARKHLWEKGPMGRLRPLMTLEHQPCVGGESKGRRIVFIFWHLTTAIPTWTTTRPHWKGSYDRLTCTVLLWKAAKCANMRPTSMP